MAYGFLIPIAMTAAQAIIQNMSKDDTSGQLGDISNQFAPWQQGGFGAFTDSLGRYKQMLNNPDFLENQLASNYKTSNYAQGQLKNVSQYLNDNAATTGLLGSGYAAGNLADQLQNVISKDEGQYIDRGTNLYQRGLSGEENASSLGLQALNDQAKYEAEMAAAQAAAASQRGDMLSSLFGQGASLLGDYFSGGTGGMSGLIGQMGKKAGYGSAAAGAGSSAAGAAT